MSVTVDWDTPDKTVIRYQYVGRWTWPEYEQAAKRAALLVREEGRQVSVIADFSQSGMLPKGLLSGFERSLQATPLDFDVVVIVSKTELLLRMIEVFRRLNQKVGAKLLTTNSLEEARTLLSKRQSQA